ncbi:MAG: response regulator [Chloroflexaceae bacterium]|nr:response regulator [Chloroflexaceae bacterium]
MQTTSTVLIVDDEPTGRETMEALLIGHGYHLVFASNGPEALAQAVQLTPDLILLDVMMPVMDGFEVCRRLRADPVLAEVPVVMVTALDDQESRLRGIEAGADDFISKPFHRAELRARVRTITRLNRYRRLLAERARFEWVVEQAESGFVIVDEQGRVQYANRQACLYLSLPPSWYDPTTSSENEIQTFLALARKHYRCEPPEAWERWPGDPGDAGNQQLSGGDQDAGPDQPLRYLVKPETSTSHAVWLQVDTFDLPAGSGTGLLVRLRDVTTQMTRQRQIWSFHSIISHKLATPLSGLISSLYLLTTGEISLQLPTEAKEYADIAMQSAQRLQRDVQTIRNYLKLSDRACSGGDYLLADIPQTIEQVRRESGVETVCLSGHESLEPTWLALSQHAVEELFRQVLENARKFHPTHTPTVDISFSSSQAPSHAPSHGDAVCIRIRDDGMTLSPEQLATRGCPITRPKRTSAGKCLGWGLG